MPLASITDLTIGFRGPPLLDRVTLQIEPGERIGLLGRNGAGKTTLMRILGGVIEPDGGQVALATGIKVAMLSQDVPHDVAGSVSQVVATGLAESADDHEHAWRGEQRAERILDEMRLPAALEFGTLSAGLKRRVLLARALASSPDLLLLDEPTNHLDVDCIAWLEEFLSRTSAAILFVTHDRVFLRKLATRILEIDRGKVFDWSCDYDTFLSRKEAALAAEEKENALFDKKLAIEEVWIRQGIKARRTRNEGRVRSLEAMRRARSERREKVGKARLAIEEAERSGALVAELKEVSFAYGERQIVRDFSTSVMRGDKVGFFGPNGAGKTTLLRVLLGQLAPTTGKVRLGTNLQIAYFDQLREQLDEEASVQDNIAGGNDTVTIGGKGRHVIGYFGKIFCLAPSGRGTPVKFLSGGERNRVLLARLFSKPANVLVLDEPTNDLDTETLELLEQRLVEFQGTVLVVSHDRALLNNVVTSMYVFTDGGVEEFIGDYDDWMRVRAKRAAESAKAETSRATAANTASRGAGAAGKRKLTFKEQQELKKLPEKLESLERDIAALHGEMAQATFYQQSGEQIATAQARLKRLEEEFQTAFSRWEELELLVG